ncbi:MAG: hypothetical protein WAU96_09635 [Anaerolineae bacterium]
MIQRLHTPVTVAAVFDHRTRQIVIKRMIYDGRDYAVQCVPYHYTRRVGRMVVHVYCVATGGAYFKLAFNTETLLWIVEEIHDHEPSSFIFQSEAPNHPAH